MNNTTLLSLRQNMGHELTDIDDTFGAIVFTVVVLLWYSSSIIFLLRMQMIAPAESIEGSVEYSRKLSIQSFQEKTNDKKILEELGDKGKRDKLWDIYFGKSGDMNNKITRAEPLRIRNIQRRLSSIKEFDQDKNEKIHYLNQNTNSFHSNLLQPASNRSPFNRQYFVRRQTVYV